MLTQNEARYSQTYESYKASNYVNISIEKGWTVFRYATAAGLWRMAVEAEARRTQELGEALVLMGFDEYGKNGEDNEIRTQVFAKRASDYFWYARSMANLAWDAVIAKTNLGDVRWSNWRDVASAFDDVIRAGKALERTQGWIDEKEIKRAIENQRYARQMADERRDQNQIEGN